MEITPSEGIVYLAIIAFLGKIIVGFFIIATKTIFFNIKTKYPRK